MTEVFRDLWLAAAVAPCLVACGDGGGTTSGDERPPAYYRQLADITAEVDEENTAADQELNDDAPDHRARRDREPVQRGDRRVRRPPGGRLWARWAASRRPRRRLGGP